MTAFQEQTGATLLDLAPRSSDPLPRRPHPLHRRQDRLHRHRQALLPPLPRGHHSILVVDVATKKTEWFVPAPSESISTRTEDGPTYYPDRKEMVYGITTLRQGRPRCRAE